MFDKDGIITRQRKFCKVIEYVNSHLALVSLLGTFSIAVSSVLFKIIVYLFSCGKYMALGVDYQYISITNENVFYQVFLYAAIGIIIFVPNYLCYYSVKSQKTFKQTCLKLLQPYIGIFITFSLVVALILIVATIFNKSEGFSLVDINWINVLKTIKDFTLAPYILFCSFGHIMAIIENIISLAFKFCKFICKKGAKKICKQSASCAPALKSNPDITLILVNVIFPIALLIVYCFVVGFVYGGELKSFKVVDNILTPKVVLCETSDYYIVSECVVDLQSKKLIIYTNTESVIDKTSTSAITVKFDNVLRETFSVQQNPI